MMNLRWLVLVFVIGCAGKQSTGGTTPDTAAKPPIAAGTGCDAAQTQILHEGDAKAAPWSTEKHLAKNFPDGKVSWLMKDSAYQKFVVDAHAANWGRCNDTGCYVFVAPAATMHAAVEKSMANGHHDPAAIGQALGLPAANFEGTLRLMTFDLTKTPVCARLPVDADPGVWACKSAEDKDCFKFGGYTSGGVPELMLINAPVGSTTIDEVQ